MDLVVMMYQYMQYPLCESFNVIMRLSVSQFRLISCVFSVSAET